MLSHRIEISYKLPFFENTRAIGYIKCQTPGTLDRRPLFLRMWKMEDSNRPTEPLADQVLHSDRTIYACSIHPVEECQCHMGYNIDKDLFFFFANVPLETHSQNLWTLGGRTALTQGHSTPSHTTQVRPSFRILLPNRGYPMILGLYRICSSPRQSGSIIREVQER